MSLLIVFAVTFAILLLFVAIIFRDKNSRKDYHNFFILGVIWAGAGIPLIISANSPALFVMGFVFMVVGLVHRKEWAQNIKDRENRWKKMSKKQKKKIVLFKWIMFGLLLLGFIALVIFYYLAS